MYSGFSHIVDRTKQKILIKERKIQYVINGTINVLLDEKLHKAYDKDRLVCLINNTNGPWVVIENTVYDNIFYVKINGLFDDGEDVPINKPYDFVINLDE